MEEVDVPSYFLCPISLQIMRDPVTLTTGITYDRDSIEKWIFSGKNPTCPMTKQPLPSDLELTPNHTLRRLVQAWCATNASKGVERFPTPRAPLDKAVVSRLLDDVRKPHVQIQSLRKLRELVTANDRNRHCVENSGAADVLVYVVRKSTGNESRTFIEEEEEESMIACDEALNILHSLKISEENLLILVAKHKDLIGLLTKILQQSNYQCRAYAISLLKSIFKATSPVRLTNTDDQIFLEVVKMLHDHISYNATKAALRVLAELCPWGRNRIKAVEAGAVQVLIDLLLDDSDKRLCEIVLIVLELMCGCAEGRQELLQHGAGIAVVSKKILRISNIASDRGVRILYSIGKFSATPVVVQEMLQLGVVSKLCLVLHLDCGVKTKEKAEEILRLHSRAWKNSPCIAPQLHSLYPF